jgi:hypothetical protein
MQRITTWGFMALAISAVGLTSGVAQAGGRHRPDRTSLSAEDDFLFDPALLADPTLLEQLLSTITCPGHESTGNPLLPCPPGSRVRIRRLTTQSALDASDPRFSGLQTTTINGNLDSHYAGRVWGRWTLQLDSGEGVWHGTWHGRRTRIPDGAGPGADSWIADAFLSGYGTGSLAGWRVRARESAVTYTPFPVPYEALAFLGLPGPCAGGECPPEGLIEGTLVRLHSR